MVAQYGDESYLCAQSFFFRSYSVRVEVRA